MDGRKAQYYGVEGIYRGVDGIGAANKLPDGLPYSFRCLHVKHGGGSR